MKATTQSQIAELDDKISLLYVGLTLTSWLRKPKWLRQIDAALDQRLTLMAQRDSSI